MEIIKLKNYIGILKRNNNLYYPFLTNEEKLNILFKNLFEEVENNQKEDNDISVTNIDLKNSIGFLVKSYKHKEENKIKNIFQ